MPLNQNRYYPQALLQVGSQIQNSDGTTGIVLLTPGSNWSLLESLGCSSTDTVARDIQVYVTISSIDYPLFTVSVPLGAGTSNSAVPINLLSKFVWNSLSIDAFGNSVYMLKTGTVLKAKALVALTSTKIITFTGYATDY